MNHTPRAFARMQLSDHVAAHVRALIMAGTLRPGMSVRPEAIGEELGVSTTPAREALQLLRAEGFLELAPGRGFTVAPLTGDDIRDLFTTQALLAGELAARAAESVAGSDLDKLETLHHGMIADAQRQDAVGLETKNHEFHRLINRLAGSRKLRWALGLLTRYVPREFYASIPGWPAATLSDHDAILTAIREGSPARARVAMQEHIVHAGELLAQNFDLRGSD